MATQKDTKKKSIRVKDLKPAKDAKGGGGRSLDGSHGANAGGRNLDGSRTLDGGKGSLNTGGGRGSY